MNDITLNCRKGKAHPIPCFGVGCEIHQLCHRYTLIEGSTPWQVRLGHCGTGGNRVLFLHPPAPPEVPAERRTP